MVAIIDYGAGNIQSVQNAFERIGEKSVCTSDRNTILSADRILLPGVGAFADAMNKLKESCMDRVVVEAVENKIPFLGICLGMQLLFAGSEEGPGVPGLSFFDDEIKHFETDKGYKVPQIGWNSMRISKDSRLFYGIPDNSYAYFVHSYYLRSKRRDIVAATCDYINEFDAAVETERLFACQFHPEKSGEAGLKMLKNFTEIR